MTTDQAHSLHHVNFPTADLKTTEEWYGKVFGMTRVQPVRTPPNGTMLLTRGNFDLHFRPVDKADVQTGLIHFAIEVEDWDTFVTHLDTIEVPYVE
ncbi:VOC family protein, partial [Streptomyces sp. NPDC002666]